MGQANSDLDGIENVSKDKGNFIDELIGANYEEYDNKRSNKKHSKLTKTDNNQMASSISVPHSGASTISKNPTNNQMIVRKKLITTTTTSSMTNLSNTIVDTTHQPQQQQQQNQQQHTANNKMQNEHKTISTVQKEQLEYEFHIKPPAKKKLNNTNKKRKKTKNPDKDAGRFNSFFSSLFRTNATRTMVANINDNMDVEFPTAQVNKKSNFFCCLTSKNRQRTSLFSNLSKNSPNNPVKQNKTSNRPSSEKTKRKYATANPENFDDYDYYTEPPPVTCIRVLRPSNDLSAVRFDSHYNIIDIKNKNEDNKSDAGVA